MPLYLLLSQNFVSSLLKKRPGRNGGVGQDISLDMSFQPAAESSGDSLPLVLFVDVETIQISGFINVPKTCDPAIFNGY